MSKKPTNLNYSPRIKGHKEREYKKLLKEDIEFLKKYDLYEVLENDK